MKLPDGHRLCFLPPYSPELQPAERLWPLTDETVANKSFEFLEELGETLGQRCLALADQPAIFNESSHFHWWTAG